MQETVTHYCYTAEEEAAVTRAMEAGFGPVTQVLRELVSPGIRVDLCVAEMEGCRAVITRGMGAGEMSVPEELRGQGYERAELVVMLPPDWDIHGQQEGTYWPLRWLKLLARLPWEEQSWLGWGHSVPGGEPFAEDTGFDSLLLLDAFVPKERRQGAEPAAFTLPGGETLRFYQLFPLYPEELQFKLEQGTQALIDRLLEAKLLRPILEPQRANLFPPASSEKQLLLQPQGRRQLLRGWQGPARCLATDRIVVDGAPVGYCYREAPCAAWDSGWRFTAGDESDSYMDDPGHSDIYSLNCIANYDEDILPILHSPAPCAFARGPGGLERLKNIL